MGNNVDNTIGFLFDLDGVLIDSEKEYTRIWDEINRTFPTGIPDLPIRIKGMTLVEIVERYFNTPQYKEEVPKMLTRLEEEMTYEWLTGARDLLLTLKEEKIPRVLVTSSNKKKMALLRTQLPEVENYFSHIITGDRVTHSKPHPEGYNLGASLIGCPARRCVVFEDSLQGVKAGKAAGAFVIGVAGTLPGDKLAPFSDIVINSLNQIDYKSVIEILRKR